LPLDVEIDGVRLHGRLGEMYPGGIARLRFGAPNGPSTLRHGLDWLLLRAAGVELPFVEFHDAKDRGIGPHPRAAVTQDAAIDALRTLLALRQEGLQRPLPFAPYSAWELFAADTPERGLREALGRWRGSGNGGWAEGAGDALQLALRGRDPFADEASLREFARIAGLVFGAVRDAAPAPIDLDDTRLPDDDAEDAA
jgi:exodeoxyribonuclease V gamma subunit